MTSRTLFLLPRTVKLEAATVTAAATAATACPISPPELLPSGEDDDDDDGSCNPAGLTTCTAPLWLTRKERLPRGGESVSRSLEIGIAATSGT